MNCSAIFDLIYQKIFFKYSKTTITLSFIIWNASSTTYKYICAYCECDW